jgi:phage minor structural protein
MVKLFSPTDKLFNSNGDKIIIPTKAVVHKEDNGDFYLELDCGLEYINDIVENAILVVRIPQGEQAFRVQNVTKTKSKLTTKAWHIFYDSENYLIKDSYVVDKNCAEALYHLNSATEPASPFVVFSDIEQIGSFRCVRKSLYEAFTTVQERWGGHFIRDNFSFGLRKQIGVDTGVTIRYRKNIKDITCEENWNDVVTEILPVGKDGILLNELDPLRSVYIKSTTQYSVPYTKTVSFTQDEIDPENFTDGEGNLDETQYKTALMENLAQQALNYLEENKKPKITYTLSAHLEEITDIGDIVTVIHEPLNIELTASIIGFDYDCILKKYKQIIFGNFSNSLSNLLGDIKSATNEGITKQTNYLQNYFRDEITTLESDLTKLFVGGVVYYNGNRIVVMDKYPVENAKNILLIDNEGISFSTNGINGEFKQLYYLNGEIDFSKFSKIYWGNLDLGRAKDKAGALRLFDGTNSLQFLLNNVGFYSVGENNFIAKSNRKSFLEIFNGNDEKVFSIKENTIYSEQAEINKVLKLGENVYIRAQAAGIGIFTG